MPNLAKYGVFAAAIFLGQGLLQFGTNTHAEEESEEPPGGIWITAASYDLPALSLACTCCCLQGPFAVSLEAVT